jgi:hypothetical protein
MGKNIFLEKQTVALTVKKSASFMQSDSSVSRLRELVTRPYPEPHDSRCGIGSGQSCPLFLHFVALIYKSFSNSPI